MLNVSCAAPKPTIVQNLPSGICLLKRHKPWLRLKCRDAKQKYFFWIQGQNYLR